LQQRPDGRLVDPVRASHEVAQQGFEDFDHGLSVLDLLDQRQQLAFGRDVAQELKGRPMLRPALVLEQ